MSRRINTVTGPIGVEDLGRTLMHEHILASLPGAEFDPTLAWDRQAVIERAIERLKDLRAHGVKTFVDPCPIELGRDVELLAEVSERSGMQIICTTGFYQEPLGLPSFWRLRSVDEIAELYLREIEIGVGTTGIRAGAIKCATSSAAISETEAHFLKAASIAQSISGVPIITHTEDGIGAPEQQAALIASGAEADRCLIGHCCGNADPAYHEKVVRGGSFIGFDRIGMAAQQSDVVRADNLMLLVRNGFAAQIMMSQDRVCHYVGKLRPMAGVDIDTINAKMKTGELPGPYTYMFTDFLPMLRQRGLSEEMISAILEDNPRRLFNAEGVKATWADGAADTTH